MAASSNAFMHKPSEVLEGSRAAAAKALTDLVTSLARPRRDQFSAYAKAAYAIYRDASEDFTALVDKQVAASNRQLAEAVETLARNAPAGTEGVVPLIRQSMSAAHQAYEQVNQAGRKFAEVAEGHLSQAGAAKKR